MTIKSIEKSLEELWNRVEENSKDLNDQKAVSNSQQSEMDKLKAELVNSKSSLKLQQSEITFSKAEVAKTSSF